MKITFKPENNIPYGQDFRWDLINIPSGIRFNVMDFKFNNDLYKLTASGYGDSRNYGNGSIFVKKKYIIGK